MKKVILLFYSCFLIVQTKHWLKPILLMLKFLKKLDANTNRKAIMTNSYGYVDDRDIFGQRQFGRIIDLDERINFPYYYPTINNGFFSIVDNLYSEF